MQRYRRPIAYVFSSLLCDDESRILPIVDSIEWLQRLGDTVGDRVFGSIFIHEDWERFKNGEN